MNEKEFGNKVAGLLQSNLNKVDDATCAKLNKARQIALARFEEEERARSLTWAGPFGERVGNAFSQRPLLWAPLVALVLALGISGYLEYSQNDGDDSDAFLLAGDLPIQAYIHQDFDAWLKAYSR